MNTSSDSIRALARRCLGSFVQECVEDQWREAREEACVAYEQWSDAAPERRASAYAVYRAAEEREAAAAAHMWALARAIRTPREPVAAAG
jgi:hypothetical protein